MITNKNELIGTWEFNESNLTFQVGGNTSGGIDIKNIVFNSNNEQFNNIFGGGGRNYGVMNYDNTNVYSDNTGTFINQAYRTIEITDVSSLTNEQEFINFMNANATKKVTTPPKAISLDNLKTFKEECDKTYKISQATDTNLGAIKASAKTSKDTQEVKIDSASGKLFVDALSKNDLENISMNVTCNHEYEVTGKTGHTFNLAIPKQAQMVIKKLKGQTRRKSLNLFDSDLTSKSLNGYSISYANGVFTINYNNIQAWQGLDIRGTKVLNLVGGQTYTLYANLPKGFSLRIGYTSGGTYHSEFTIDSNRKIMTKTFPSDATGFSPWLQSTENLNISGSAKFSVQILQGTFNETNIPPFEPFDNNLVSSACNFKVIGRNFLNSATLVKENILDNGTTSTDNNWRTSDYITLVQNQDYSVSFAINTSYRIAMYDESKTFIKLLTFEGTKATFKTLGKYIKIAYKPNGNTSKLMLNYGTNALPYEDYQESTLPFGLPLGQYDYIENGTLYKGTSGVVTLNGSELWYEETANTLTNTKLYKFFHYDLATSIGTDFITNSTLPIRSDYLTSDVECIGIDKSNTYLRLNKTKFANVDSVKQWLAQNSIQIAYHIETIQTKVGCPSGYGVFNSGMEIQETQTLPYIIDKVYPVSLGSQLENNVEIDREQELLIRKLSRHSSKPIELNLDYLITNGVSSIYSTFKNMAHKMSVSNVFAILSSTFIQEPIFINNDDIIDAQTDIYVIVKVLKVMTYVIWKITPNNEMFELWSNRLNGFNPFNEDLSTIDYRTPGSKELTLQQGVTNEDISILAQSGKINSIAFEPFKGMGVIYIPIIGFDSGKDPMFAITMHKGNGAFQYYSISFDGEVKQKWEISWN